MGYTTVTNGVGASSFSYNETRQEILNDIAKIKKENADFLSNLRKNNYGLNSYSGYNKEKEIPVAQNLNAEEIWESIDPEERKLVEGVDLTEVDKYSKKPIYMIAKGSQDGKYHIYKNGRAIKNLELGNNILMDFNSKTQKVEGSSEQSVDIEYLREELDFVDGNYDDYGDFGYDFFSGILEKLRIKITESKTKGFYVNDGQTLSPLVVDYNQDGKVSAQAGMGVDIDGDGKADGAATDGDKMLAMSDTNGNGTIDGTEVFGNKTVNPFTGKALNAKNGFEALKQIAQSATEKTGINCFDGKNVDLNKLKQALSAIGVNLGFVSGNNNTQLEALSKINKINVFDYLNKKETGKVQHNQQGSGTSSDGSVMKVDDVWFEA